MRILFFAALSLALTLGCQSPADSSGDPSGTTTGSTTDSTTSTATEPQIPGCTADVLEKDGLKAGPLSGPGVDPATGELTNLPKGFVVSTTYLALKPGADTKDLFFKILSPVQAQMKADPGMLAVQLWMSNKCSTARTLAVWKDEAAMVEFATSGAHADAASQIGDISRGESVITHWEGASAADVTWEVAAQKLGEADGPSY